MKTPTATVKSSRLLGGLVAGILLLGGGAPGLCAQRPAASAPDAASFTRDTVALLEIGLDDAAVLAHWNRLGWPASVPDMTLVQVREAGGGLELLARIRALMPAGTEYARLAEILENHDLTLADRKRLRFLRPRGYVEERLEGSDRRLAFHEHDRELDGWFRRTSYFVFVHDAGHWRARNEGAIGRIVVDAMRRRLELGGMEVGELAEERLINKRTDQEYELHSVLVRDGRNNLRGSVFASARVIDEAGIVVVMGFLARLDAANPVIPDCKSRLGEMLSSLVVDG